MSEREKWMPSEAAFDWISGQLRRDGNFAATIANSSLYQECGRSADAFDAVAELVEPIVRAAVERALAEQERKVRREALQEAARAVCRRCSSDVPIFDREINWYYHGDGIGCDASRIHDLLAKLDKEGS